MWQATFKNWQTLIVSHADYHLHRITTFFSHLLTWEKTKEDDPYQTPRERNVKRKEKVS